MKRTLSILLSLTLLALCAGCQRAEESPAPAPVPQGETAEPADQPPPAAPSDSVTFQLPDGETVSSADALQHQPGAPDGQEVYRFDFAFLRYRQPVYQTTLTRPDLVNLETLEFAEDVPEELEDVAYLRVKPGDVLENGLTVEKADFWCYHGVSEATGQEGDWCSTSSISLSGSLTLEGMLIAFSDEDGYIDLKGDLLFYPDSTENPLIPAPYTEGPSFTLQLTDAAGQIGLVSDGCFRLGNREDSELDLTGILPEDGRFVWVRVTLEDIDLNYRAMTGGAFAVAKMTELEELAPIEEPGD